MSQVKEPEETTKYVEEAEKVLQGIECKEEGKGMVTSTMVRKIFELTESKSYREFKLRFRYAVVRNIPEKKALGETQLERFYSNLISVAEKVEEANRLPYLRKLMEYVVMLHTVKAKLGG